MPPSPEKGNMRAREVTEMQTTCFRLEFFLLFNFLVPAMGHPRGA